MQRFEIQTRQRSQMIDISAQVQQHINQAHLAEGVVMVFIPHTTAGITINENADPDVVHDMLEQLDRMVPWKQPFYQHGEGNSAAHVKASMMGSSVTVIVKEGQMQLGTWQGLWFCEFDGPRQRSVWVHCSQEAAAAPGRT